MIRFWFSNEKLTEQGLKLAWFGVLVTCIGLVFTDLKWLSWFGLGGTIVGLILRHRVEHLKKIHSAPRKLTTEQTEAILQSLRNVSKQPMTVGYYGQDLEAKQYAEQIKTLLESAGFTIVRLEGFIVFSLSFGLEITVYKSCANEATGIGMRDAFQGAGIPVRLEKNSNNMTPAISLNVHGKPPLTELPAARETGKS